MDVWILVAVVVVVVLIAVAAYFGLRSRQSSDDRGLKEQFGSEYDRVAERASDEREAERELERRVERHDSLDITPLSDEKRQRYVEEWRDVQRRFVDDPEGTLGDADRLITQAMRDRGYPTEHLDQKIEDLSVEHGDRIDAYREAHEIADRHEREGVSTDELRHAMQRYRKIFEEIVETRTTTGE